MKTIKITNQKKWDDLPDSFKEETEIIIVGELYQITHKEKALFCIKKKAKIQGVWGNATIQSVGDNATIQSVGDNATIQRVGDNATIQSVRGNATIQRVWGNATIQSVWGNATIKIYSSMASVKKALQACVIICQDCNPKLPKNALNVIHTKTAIHTIESFTSFYDNLVKGKTMTLYKSVNPETECDFYTGRIKYENGKTVNPDKFDPSTERECGDGLHLSPSPEMALSYNNGKVKICEVAIKDIVVYSKNITKVRCSKVKVIGDYNPQKP
jgi:hypothetical protein